MSYLPDGSTRGRQWAGSLVGSFAVHIALIATALVLTTLAEEAGQTAPDEQIGITWEPELTEQTIRTDAITDLGDASESAVIADPDEDTQEEEAPQPTVEEPGPEAIESAASTAVSDVARPNAIVNNIPTQEFDSNEAGATIEDGTSGEPVTAQDRTAPVTQGEANESVNGQAASVAEADEAPAVAREGEVVSENAVDQAATDNQVFVGTSEAEVQADDESPQVSAERDSLVVEGGAAPLVSDEASAIEFADEGITFESLDAGPAVSGPGPAQEVEIIIGQSLPENSSVPVVSEPLAPAVGQSASPVAEAPSIDQAATSRATISGGSNQPEVSTSNAPVTSNSPRSSTEIGSGAVVSAPSAPNLAETEGAAVAGEGVPVDSLGFVERPSTQQRAVAELLAAIRSAQTAAPQCGLALPRLSTDGEVALAIFGDADATRTAYIDAIGDLPFGTEIRETNVSALQCPALNALRAQIRDYPATRVGISLEAAQVNSGDILRGDIFGVGGRAVTALLVDEAGVVQDLLDFMRVDGAGIELSVPVTRTTQDQPIDRTQLLLVLSMPVNIPLPVGDLDGAAAVDVMGSLGTLSEAHFGIIPFFVR